MSYQIVRCRGCLCTGFRYYYADYESAYPIDEDRWEHPETEDLYPYSMPDYAVSHYPWGLPSDVYRLYDETLKDFLAGIDERMAKLKEYKSDGNCADYAVEAHALKSDSKYLGFTKLADDALNHEMAGKNNDRLFIEKNYQKLEKEVEKIVNITRIYLGE